MEKVNKNMYHIFSIKSENQDVFWTFHAPKAREKRPGDEVGQISSKIFGNIILRDGPLEKLSGEWGIFEPQEFFSLSNSLYEFFLGRSMNIF